MHIILESKTYQLNSKLNNINIYYINNDQTMTDYIILIKKMLENQFGIQVSLLESNFCFKLCKIYT